MPTPYDVPTPIFIEKLTQYLMQNVDTVTPPAWANVVKTGSHAQRPPENPNWWFIRCASILRKIYVKGPIGIARLRAKYGGRFGPGMKPEHARKGGGAIARKAVQQLEAAGLVEPLRNRGRVVTGNGRRVLDRLSAEIKKDLAKELPELKKY